MTARPVLWPGDDESKPAPEPLVLVQTLVNTVERPDGSDRLADPTDARPWLVDNHLLAPHAELTDADLDLVRTVREALRAMLVHNAGGPPPNKTALAVLQTVSRDAQRDGTWTRLKACANDECQWAFYDRSRNHGGAWCEMAACGNKLKNRAFRARSKAAPR
jgi:hypothetical protein